MLIDISSWSSCKHSRRLRPQAEADASKAEPGLRRGRDPTPAAQKKSPVEMHRSGVDIEDRVAAITVARQ